MPTDLHTALQREREAWMQFAGAKLGESGRAWQGVRERQRATDQALAALEVKADPKAATLGALLITDVEERLARAEEAMAKLQDVARRPTLEDVEKAVQAVPVLDPPMFSRVAGVVSRGAVLQALRALYPQGGE